MTHATRTSLSTSSARRAATAALVSLTMGAVACSSTTDPADVNPNLVLSTDRVAGVSVVLQGVPAVVAPGETVPLRVVALNGTNRRIQIGQPCGPPMDAIIVTPDGGRHSALIDRVGPDAFFTCPLTPVHFVEPHSTRTIELPWVAPSTRGVYTAVGGVRRHSGLANASGAVRFVVR